MAKETAALGIVVGVKDLASKILQKLGLATENLAHSMEDAQKAGHDLADAFSGNNLKGLAKAKAGLSSLGKEMFGLSGDFHGVNNNAKDLISVLGGVVEAIPVVGPLISKTGSALFTLMTRAADVRKEIAQLEIQFTGLGGVTTDLTLQFLDLSNRFGRNQEDVMHLSRAIGTVNKDFLLTTERVMGAGKALGIADDEAAKLIMTADAFKMTRSNFEGLAGSVIQFQRQFQLPGLVENLPEIFDSVRRSSIALGLKFENMVGPATQTVSDATVILNKKLGLLPKQAAMVALHFTQSFEEMGFNLKAVFTGVEDTFDSKTESLMELFVRSGKGATDAFSAINKAAAGQKEGYIEIADALDTMVKRGAPGIERMRVLLVKQFGPEASKIFENLSGDAQMSLGKDFPDLLKKAKTPAEEFQATLDKVMGSTNELVNRLNVSVNNLVGAFATQMPESMTKFENIMKNGLDILNAFETKGIGPIAEQMEKYLAPALDKVAKAFAEFSGEAIANMKEFANSLVDSLKKIADVFEDFRNSTVGGMILGDNSARKLGEKQKSAEAGLQKLPSLQSLPPAVYARAVQDINAATALDESMAAAPGGSRTMSQAAITKNAIEDAMRKSAQLRGMDDEKFNALVQKVSPEMQKYLIELRGSKIDLTGQMKISGAQSMANTLKGVLVVPSGETED